MLEASADVGDVILNEDRVRRGRVKDEHPQHDMVPGTSQWEQQG